MTAEELKDWLETGSSQTAGWSKDNDGKVRLARARNSNTMVRHMAESDPVLAGQIWRRERRARVGQEDREFYVLPVER